MFLGVWGLSGLRILQSYFWPAPLQRPKEKKRKKKSAKFGRGGSGFSEGGGAPRAADLEGADRASQRGVPLEGRRGHLQRRGQRAADLEGADRASQRGGLEGGRAPAGAKGPKSSGLRHLSAKGHAS